MKNAIYPLFPYPLVIPGRRYQFSAAEREFIAGLAMTDNTGNRMSESDTVLHSEALAGLRQFIDEQLLNYKKNLLRIRDDNEIYITQSWLNVADAGQFHPKHRHPNSIVSGVLFLDENAAGDLPPLRFHRTLDMYPVEFMFEELNEFNANCRQFAPEEGMLMLFPSLLEHDVERNNSKRTRSSISFNTYVRGTLGSRGNLTELSIS